MTIKPTNAKCACCSARFETYYADKYCLECRSQPDLLKCAACCDPLEDEGMILCKSCELYAERKAGYLEIFRT